MLLAGAAGIVSPFTAWDVWGESAAGDVANASLFLNADGGVQSSTADADGGGTNGSLEYYSPNLAGIGNLFWVRFTATSGTFTSNDASTWTQLSSTRGVTKASVAGTGSVTFTIEIASDSGGSNVVMTSAGNILRYTHI